MTNSTETDASKLPVYWFAVAGIALIGLLGVMLMPGIGPTARIELELMLHHDAGTR